jgi:hypothetical protein
VKTKDVIEGLLYVSGNNQLVKQALELSHILSDDRDWENVPHLELFYLDRFKSPTFLCVVDKIYRVYIIGEREKGQSYNVLEIDGMTTTHLTISKGELKKRMLQVAKETKELYLPDTFAQRLIYIKPDYLSGRIADEDIYIFNRLEDTGTLFTPSKWSIGVDIYSTGNKEFKTSGNDIIKAIFAEF